MPYSFQIVEKRARDILIFKLDNFKKLVTVINLLKGKKAERHLYFVGIYMV